MPQNNLVFLLWSNQHQRTKEKEEEFYDFDGEFGQLSSFPLDFEKSVTFVFLELRPVVIDVETIFFPVGLLYVLL